MIPACLVIDTDIVIHLLKKNAATVTRFVDVVAAKSVVWMSPVVVAEVYAGAFENEHAAIEGFFSLCQHLTLDRETGRIAGRYARRFSKSHQGISLEDYLLAASANVHRCPLWTGDQKHFPMDDITLFH